MKIFRFGVAGGAPDVVHAPASGAVTDLRAAEGTIVGRFSASTDPGQIVRFDPAAKSYTALASNGSARASSSPVSPGRQRVSVLQGEI